jgi:transcriptional regulator with XRE-family HTH domain
MRACDFCKGEGQVSSEVAERWREGRAIRDARIKEGRSQLQEAKRLGISPVDLNDIEFGRKSKRDVLNENHSSDGKKRNTAHYYGEVYVGCGERRDGRCDVIVVSPAGDREDVRIVQPDLEFSEAADIAGRLRKRVREFPQAEAYSADELLALCTRLRDQTDRVS